jgi:peroxiredoxin
MLREGSLAPDFTLPTADGQPVSLSDTLHSGRNVLLVFLRHLG